MGNPTQQCRVSDESLMVVKLFAREEDLTVPREEAPANSVPAAVVIRRVQAFNIAAA